MSLFGYASVTDGGQPLSSRVMCEHYWLSALLILNYSYAPTLTLKNDYGVIFDPTALPLHSAWSLECGLQPYPTVLRELDAKTQQDFGTTGCTVRSSNPMKEQ